jgi:hypothetical protein
MKTYSRPQLTILVHFPLEIGAGICSSNNFLLLADSKNWHIGNNAPELQGETYIFLLPMQKRLAYLRHQLIGFPLSFICSGCPLPSGEYMGESQLPSGEYTGES